MSIHSTVALPEYTWRYWFQFVCIKSIASVNTLIYHHHQHHQTKYTLTKSKQSLFMSTSDVVICFNRSLIQRHSNTFITFIWFLLFFSLFCVHTRISFSVSFSRECSTFLNFIRFVVTPDSIPISIRYDLIWFIKCLH